MQPLRNLGDFIRDQRKVSDVSLRQLAAAAGVSNPYLSQIERGLRRPSADILQQLAKALRISSEALYVQAGMLDERVSGTEVALAVQADPGLSEQQKQVLLEIYDSFRQENEPPAAGDVPAGPVAPPAAATPPATTPPATTPTPATPTPTTPTPKPPAARRTPAKKAAAKAAASTSTTTKATTTKAGKAARNLAP